MWPFSDYLVLVRVSVYLWLLLPFLATPTPVITCMGRKVLNETRGLISDGEGNYNDSTHCEWLIVGGAGRMISLRFSLMETECLYDYLFVYDGDSYKSKLIGSFSGKYIPSVVVAKSGNMLIHFFSDRNSNMAGFLANYTVSDCVLECSGHGTCDPVAHTCKCERAYTGEACEEVICTVNGRRGDCIPGNMLCDEGYVGRDCSLLLGQPSEISGLQGELLSLQSDTAAVPGWHRLVTTSSVFTSRTGHAGAWVEPCMYVFGGTDLNNVLDDLLYYCLNISSRGKALTDWMRVPRGSPWPRARHGHTMVAHTHTRTLYMFGGTLADESCSNELWAFNIERSDWRIIGSDSHVIPVGVTGHSMTMVEDRWVYVFGGRTENRGLTSNMYRIDVNQNNYTHWVRVKGIGGRGSVRRLVGHSAVYHPGSQTIMVYGGFTPDNARFPRRVGTMLSFHVPTERWTELHAPHETYSRSVPRERAYHRAVVVGGEYMLVHGGNIHLHDREERCFDESLYLYHLTCHTWINVTLLQEYEVRRLTQLSAQYFSGDRKGRFGHAVVTAYDNLVLVSGGYRGSILGDLTAYYVPENIIMPKIKQVDSWMKQMCGRYLKEQECMHLPQCIWCVLNDTSLRKACVHRNQSQVCKGGGSSTCPGVCSLMSTCGGCTGMRGGDEVNHCVWCVKDSTCHHINSARSECKMTGNLGNAWWNSTSLSVTHVSQCNRLDKPSGLHNIKYRHPANYSLPDEVMIVPNATVEFTFAPVFERERNITRGFYTSVFRGFIHPPNPSLLTDERGMGIQLVGQHCESVVYLSTDDNPANKEKVGELKAINQQTSGLRRPDGSLLFPLSGGGRGRRYFVEVESRQVVATPNNSQLVSRMGLEWSGVGHRYDKGISYEYLEPYGGGNCSSYLTCLSCMTDTSCGWCSDKCIQREGDVCESLITNTELCPQCSDSIDCFTCLQDDLCEWLVADARCTRRGRFNESLTARNESSAVNICPVDCLLRTNSSWCLADKNECAWCVETSRCFAFNEYISRFEYGSCNDWMDSVTLGSASDCAARNDCRSCLADYRCGWCGNVHNPTYGLCHRGDFTGPESSKTCSMLVTEHYGAGFTETDEADWSYTDCPDVDECSLGLHSCHSHATCTNTHTDYVCECKRGFFGDGRTSCNRTCYEDCEHGTCSGAPLYQCDCSLGWTGVDCSVNCGCNNHSTCSTGVGTCDLCHQYTTGQHCDLCVPGSYGDPLSPIDCRPCQCNGHGDVAEGVCHNVTGVCHCTDDTTGASCDRCMQGYYGDPRDGGRCYRMCGGRDVLNDVKEGALGSYRRMGFGDHSHVFCLWILSVNQTETTPSMPERGGASSRQSLITLSVEPDMRASCNKDPVYVYDGVAGFPGLTGADNEGGGLMSVVEGSGGARLLGVICSDDSSTPRSLTARSGYMTVLFETYFSRDSLLSGFNATYKTYDCPFSQETDGGGGVSGELGEGGGVEGGGAGVEGGVGRGVCPQNSSSTVEGCVEEMCMTHQICPLNCSYSLQRGNCVQGVCKCEIGYGGRGCVEEVGGVFRGVGGQDPPRERTGHSLVSCYDGALYMFGGHIAGHGPVAELWRYDPLQDIWSLLIPASSDQPTARYDHAAVCVENLHVLIVFGGILEDLTSTNQLWYYSLDSARWTLHKSYEGVSPLPIAGHSMTLVDELMVYIVGGFTQGSHFSELVYLFDSGRLSWLTLANIPGARPAGLYGHSAVYHSDTDSIYIHGGMSYEAGGRITVSSSLYSLDISHRSANPRNFSFMLLSSSAQRIQPVERWRHGAVVIGDKYMVVVGGYNRTSPQTTVLAYHFSCKTWFNITPTNYNLQPLLQMIGPAASLPTSSPAASPQPLIQSDAAGSPPSSLKPAASLPSSYQSVSPHSSSEQIFMMSVTQTSGLSGALTRVTLPVDLCRLQTTVESCVSTKGCSACTVLDTSVTLCYSTAGDRPDGCLLENKSAVIHQGLSCELEQLEAQNCSRYHSCAECVSVRSAGRSQACAWCSNCPVGVCIRAHSGCPIPELCSVVQQHVIAQVDLCPERQCLATNCLTCNSLSHCSWSRLVGGLNQSSRAVSRAVSRAPVFEWSCAPQSLTGPSPTTCPAPCSQHTSCTQCLHANHSCGWSLLYNRCLPKSFMTLACTRGRCGLVVEGRECPVDCSNFTRCSQCLAEPRCGWCEASGVPHGGRGVCMMGGLGKPWDKVCSTSVFSTEPWFKSYLMSKISSSWSFLSCPAENECGNGHSTCDVVTEKCVDLEQGYQCECREGYSLGPGDQCQPVCAGGCVHGVCTQPNVCTCWFGYVGDDCSHECRCNKHSTCRGPQQLSECLECHNNTLGAQCERCKPFYVGSGVNGGTCVSCLDLCNKHTNTCMTADDEFRLTQSRYYSIQIQRGPSSKDEALCYRCGNNAEGKHCGTCRDGYFRLKNQSLTEPCIKCNCNGHSDTCNREKGDNCDCKNNTKSPRCDNDRCHEQQCTECNDNFYGTPINGHQCYRQVTVEREQCFDPKTQMNCNPSQENKLLPHRTVFFAVQPRYQNVDIRIILDVSKGGLDFYMSPHDNTFQVEVDPVTGKHSVVIDPSYKYNLVIHSEQLLREPFKPRFRRDGGRARRGTGNETRSPVYWLERWSGRESGLVTFIRVERNESFLVVENVENRLVVMLSHTVHKLKISRFYIVLHGAGNDKSASTDGILYFRQDQPHIDLFVFFSVFFSCFFLFLAVCVMLWKLKQVLDAQRSRIQRRIEMQTMASRPFSRSVVCFTSVGEEVGGHRPLKHEPDGSTSLQRRGGFPSRYMLSGGSARRTSGGSGGGGEGVNPAQLPLNPLAMEPTSDGQAMVATFVLQLPGAGCGAPVNACLGTALITSRSLCQGAAHVAIKVNASSASSVHYSCRTAGPQFL